MKHNFPLTRYKFNFQAFFYGFILSQYFNLGGYFYIGEITALAYLFFNWHKVKIKEIRKLFILAIIWATAQFLSDQVNRTTFESSLKGVLAPVLLIATVIYLKDYFEKRYNRFPSFFIGVSTAFLFSAFISKSQYFIDNPWKWGIGTSISFFFAMWYSYFRKNTKSGNLILFSLIFFIICNSYSARSLGGIVIISTAFYFLFKNGLLQRNLNALLRKPFGLFKLTFYSIILLIVINVIFTGIFTSGLYLANVTEEESEKSTAQAKNNLGILLGGRSESLVSTKAFLDKPILGHGSWAKDQGNYLDLYQTLRDKYNISNNERGEINYNQTYESDLIPAHSYLMGALVWAGIFGGLFWIIIMKDVFYFIASFNSQLNYFSLLILIGFVWNIFFSPFGYEHRWLAAITISYLLYYKTEINREKFHSVITIKA